MYGGRSLEVQVVWAWPSSDSDVKLEQRGTWHMRSMHDGKQLTRAHRSRAGTGPREPRGAAACDTRSSFPARPPPPAAATRIVPPSAAHCSDTAPAAACAISAHHLPFSTRFSAATTRAPILVRCPPWSARTYHPRGTLATARSARGVRCVAAVSHGACQRWRWGGQHCTNSRRNGENNPRKVDSGVGGRCGAAPTTVPHASLVWAGVGVAREGGAARR